MNISMQSKSIRYERLDDTRDQATVTTRAWHRWSSEIKSLLALCRVWHMRYQQRRQLAQLSEFMLKDIGVSRADALQEANKPFWKD